jgi:C4-dicarboxylate transporter, DctM subunit
VERETVVLLASVLAALLFVFGTPIVLCMGLWVAIVCSLSDILPLSNFGQSAMFGLKIFALLAMPPARIRSPVRMKSGIAVRLTDFARAAFKFVPGQLAVATTVACGAFAAISGSNAATAATMGRIMIPEMQRRGYAPIFAAATAASGGIVGVIIPPSLIFIVYGVLLGLSPGDLFIAGIIPGLLMVAVMSITAAVISKRNGWDPPARPSLRETAAAAWRANLGFLGIIIALAGIFGGFFSPTEVAGVVVLYGLVAGLLFTRELKLRDVPAVFLESATINGLIAPIVGLSIILQETFTAIGVPALLQGFLEPMMQGYWPAIFTCMVLILIAGTILESVPNVILFAPILAPLAAKAGVDPIHFAIIFCVGDAIGFITPPYGLNLFVISGITRLPYIRIAMRALPYLVSVLIAWVLIAVFPPLSLALLGR